MEAENSGKEDQGKIQDGNAGKKKFRYCILYIQDGEQHKLLGLLERHLSKDRGEAFYPCMEYYRRGEKKILTKAIFPGYVFLYTNLDIREVHQLVVGHKSELNAGMRELALAGLRVSDPDIIYKEDPGGVCDLSDVSAEEEDYLD